VPCWSKNQPHLAVTLIHLIPTLIPTPTPNRARTRRILNPLLTLGDADELLLPLAEGAIPHARHPAVVCETALVDPLLAAVHETAHLLHPHPHAVVLEMTPARPLHAGVDATRLVRLPRRHPRGTETDGVKLVVIPLPTGEMTAHPRLARGMWMVGIVAGGTVDMTGGAEMITARESDRLEVIGGGGCQMRRRECMEAGDDLLVCGVLKPLHVLIL